jgi:outer membrane protein, multidrug efflux system
LLQANKAVEAANAQVRVAELARKPRISAFGTVGPVTGQLENLVLPKSGNYLVGATASIPVFEGRRNIKNVELAEQQRTTQQSQLEVRQLAAKREAEVAFDQLQQLNQQLLLQRQALMSARQTEAMARELYIKGLTVYLDVLDTQRSILEAERQITLLEGAQFIQTVALLRALGGEF